MSLLKIGGIQLGQSNTASNNFHWRNLLDGLLRLSRGNAGSPITDVMRVKADNSVEFPGGVADGVLGAGQTWQDVTASRASGTTYTNTTGKPIAVSLMGNNGANTSTLTINGVQVSTQTITLTAGTNVQSTLFGVIPTGATYSATFTAGFYKWAELRQ